MMMKLQDFIEIVSVFDTNSFKRIIFRGSDYPLLFISLLQNKLKKSYLVESIDVSDASIDTILMRFETTFLGQSIIFFIKNLNQGESKKITAVSNYIQAYKGPHSFFFFEDNDDPAKHNNEQSLIIDIDQPIDKVLFLSLLKFFDCKELKSVNEAILKIFSSQTKLTIDNACLLIHYLQMAGSAASDVIHAWLPLIIESDTSFFSLSHYFFSKNIASFYKEWQQVQSDYNDMFWITYWSEQLWRATQVTYFLQNKQFNKAKSISYRLPFSFVQQDWKKYNLEQLKKAHNFVYTMDHQLKNGSDIALLDLFYIKFFSDTF